MKKEVKQQTDVNTFDDLKFYSHHYDRFGKIAQCRFPNDYGLSVVNGKVPIALRTLLRWLSYIMEELLTILL